jgi:hypothetical protein
VDAGTVREVEPGLFHVAGPTAAPAELVERLVGAGVKVDEIAAESPTLEEVFVSLVGASGAEAA